jgi:hypothetical protein
MLYYKVWLPSGMERRRRQQQEEDAYRDWWWQNRRDQRLQQQAQSRAYDQQLSRWSANQRVRAEADVAQWRQASQAIDALLLQNRR